MTIASISGGKDSLAMSLRLIAQGETVDEFIFCDTGKEYPETYAALQKFEKDTGRTITRLKAAQTFDYKLCEKPTKMNRGIGYGWPTMRIRWCTSELKKDLIRAHLAGKGAVQLVGIAADEPKRIKVSKFKRYPLVEWGMTEADCLAYCRERGYYPPGTAYDYVRRVSCYCCPLSNLQQARYLFNHRPELWAEIKRLEEACGEKWKSGTEYYERKFKAENQQCVLL